MARLPGRVREAFFGSRLPAARPLDRSASLPTFCRQLPSSPAIEKESFRGVEGADTERVHGPADSWKHLSLLLWNFFSLEGMQTTSMLDLERVLAYSRREGLFLVWGALGFGNWEFEACSVSKFSVIVVRRDGLEKC